MVGAWVWAVGHFGAWGWELPDEVQKWQCCSGTVSGCNVDLGSVPVP
jgi:hypothetical protein